MKRRLLAKSNQDQSIAKKSRDERKEFKTEMNVNWPCIPEVKSGKQ